jgi:hypothetical protein
VLKRTTRQCEEIRQKECVEKRILRQNITFRNGKTERGRVKEKSKTM